MMIDWFKVASFAIIIVGIVVHQWNIASLIAAILCLYIFKKYMMH